MIDKNSSYQLIAKALEHVKNNSKSQGDFERIANEIGLSQFQFENLFIEWAGISPEIFFRFVSLEHIQWILKKEQTPLFAPIHNTESFYAKRSPDSFISINRMTPEEVKNNSVNYSFSESPFGLVLIASTEKGICYLAFDRNQEKALNQLKSTFFTSSFQHRSDEFQEKAMCIFTRDSFEDLEIKLHLRGTDFQLKVWGNLLKIPMGQLKTYGKLAKAIGKPKASRAVGTAIGSNPIAFLIPCHRIVRSSGKFGGYRWGTSRKTAILGWEAAKVKNTKV